MTHYDMYTDKKMGEAITRLQEKIKDADNLAKDRYGNLDYEPSWRAMRSEAALILNVSKYLFAEHLRNKTERIDAAKKSEQQPIVTAPMMEME